MPDATRTKTQIGIIGGGPSGLLLSQILHLKGITSVVLEKQSRDYVLSRIRAGVLEQGLADMLRAAEVGERLDKEGQVHTGFALAFQEKIARIDLEGLTGGKVVTVYGQTEVTRDLYEARDQMGGVVLDNAEDVTPCDIDTDAPYLTYRREGRDHRVDCDFIIACDGFHGVGRTCVPRDILKEYERVYPFGWLGILSRTKPVDHELIYSNSERGFSLCSMRTDILSRYYVQTPVDDDLDEWSDDRFWDELSLRLPPHIAERLETGPSIEKSLAPLRSFVAEPLSYGRLFLAGDAGHIVPPTGAKGLNLAASDVHYLSNALIAHYHNDDETGLKEYSDRALARVWKAVRFSWWLTSLMHQFPDEGAFGKRIQRADFDYLVSSKASMTAVAENYVGLPY